MNLTNSLSKGSINDLFSFIPKNLGIDGPVISASRTPTLYPFLDNIVDMIPVTVDLPTPPFPLITPITFLIFPYLGAILGICVSHPPLLFVLHWSLLGQLSQLAIFILLFFTSLEAFHLPR